MSVSQHRDVGIVKNIDQMLSPPDKHGISRIENDLHGGFQSGGPVRHATKRGLRPIGVADTFRHLAR